MTRIVCITVASIVANIFLSGCADTLPRRLTGYGPAAPQSPLPEAPTTKTILIISEPPGARIEVNDEYVGDTPCTVQVRCNAEGRFWQYTHIRALPVDYGYTQSKRFAGSLVNPYPVPSRIFFNMRLGPVRPDINININE